MNSYLRFQTIRVTRPNGNRTSITRTVRGVRLSPLLTMIGLTTINGRRVMVEQSEDGAQWRILDRAATENETRDYERMTRLQEAA